MKRQAIIALVLTLASFLLVRWQGTALISPLTPHGILDLEFAWDGEKLNRFMLFWAPSSVINHLYLDFLFLASYTWLLITLVKLSPGSEPSRQRFTSLAFAAGLFDACENFLIFLVLDGRFSTSVLKIVFVVATLKFLLALAVIIYLIIANTIGRRRHNRHSPKPF